MPIFCVAFMATFLASSILVPMNASNAAETTISASVTARAYTLSLTVSPNVVLDLSASPTGSMTVGAAAVSVETNAPTGYKLYMNMTGTNASTNSLIHTSNSNNTITSTGTFTNPVALANGKWGYAIPHSATSVKSTNGFSASYSTVTSGEPDDSKLFAAVPTSSQQAELIAETSTSNSGTPNQFNVYYGVKADYTVPSGTYTNKILYTGIADAGPTHNMVVFPEETPSIDGGDTLTINTSLFTTASTITANAYILDQSELTAVTASPTSISNYSASQMDCTTSTANGYLELTCTNIAKPIGNYFVYVDIPDYGQHYYKAFNYVANFYNITYMQDMTADICNDVKYVTTPSPEVYNGRGVNDTVAHSYPRATYADTGKMNTTLGVNTYRPAHLGDRNYVPETTMTDSRPSIFTKTGDAYTTDGTQVTEQVTYTVRKLADGNCWMTENLALNYEEGREFTAADTNVTTTKTAAHATQALNGVPTAQEIDTDCSTNEAQRICWTERDNPDVANDGAYQDRWLSRSTNGTPVGGTSSQAQGTYYNWYTTTMGTVNKSAGAMVATEDICPKGWRLPVYTGDGSWIHLIRDVYGLIITQGTQTDARVNNTLQKFPFSIPYSGYVNRATGAFSNQGSGGYFWSVEATTPTRARYLAFRGSNVNPESSDYKTNGLIVRCLAK